MTAGPRYLSIRPIFFLSERISFTFLHSRDGLSDQALFSEPCGIFVSNEQGAVYITESYNGWYRSEADSRRIRKLTLVEWKKSNHKLFPLSTRRSIQTLVTLHSNPTTLIGKLPHDVLYLLFQWISSPSFK